MSHPHDSQQDQVKTDNDPIKSSKPLVILSWLLLIVAIVAIMMIDWTDSETRSTSAGHSLSEEAVVERIAPIARIEIIHVEVDREPQTGEQVYSLVCTSCHAAGISGAPKFGDQADWAPYIATGFDEMMNIAINGKGAMPARGGNPNLSDLEIARAVVYMANAAGANFPEPADESAEGGEAAATEEAPAAEQAAAEPAQDAQATQEAAPAEAVAVIDESIDLKLGARIYKRGCFACHASGAAGAMKLGDKKAWAPYIARGMDSLMEGAINGKGAMPPRGGMGKVSDDELRAALAYMISKSQ
ncbi:c-type cytochrome [Orrella sp. 11846]|uniref:c-type cytochrome n=1 Tax=Orrella sp. 11846 TaxID=3409913 RepID=UPI003B5BBC73